MSDSGTGTPTDSGDGTRAVRAGLPKPVKNQPHLPGPAFAAHYHLPGEVDGPYTYGRDQNPTWSLLERAIGAAVYDAFRLPEPCRIESERGFWGPRFEQEFPRLAKECQAPRVA